MLELAEKMATNRNSTLMWKCQDDFTLVKGIFEKGFGEWESIIDDPGLWELPNELREKNYPPWVFLFMKTECLMNVPQNLEESHREFMKEYVKVRANILIDLMIAAGKQ